MFKTLRTSCVISVHLKNHTVCCLLEFGVEKEWGNDVVWSGLIKWQLFLNRLVFVDSGPSLSPAQERPLWKAAVLQNTACLSHVQQLHNAPLVMETAEIYDGNVLAKAVALRRELRIKYVSIQSHPNAECICTMQQMSVPAMFFQHANHKLQCASLFSNHSELVTQWWVGKRGIVCLLSYSFRQFQSKWEVPCCALKWLHLIRVKEIHKD